jgi:hypothetical protein
LNGKVAVVFIVLSGLVAGVAVFYLQVFAYYDPVEASSPEAEITLSTLGGVPVPMVTDNFTGIDSESAPHRFRACFTLPVSLAMLTETYRTYENPTPLIAPYWFDCFDAGALTRDLETGTAVAFLSVPEIHPGIDRVVAVYPDGRAFAWHQPNGAAE